MSRYRNKSRITELIIHCAATPNGKDFKAKNIDDWHRKRGFHRNSAFIGVNSHTLEYIGYHFVICVDGTIEVGRKLDETGAHAKGHNTISIGACMIGTDKFTTEQWISLSDGIRRLMADFKGIKVIGHNEISRKYCPGFDVQQYMLNGMQPDPSNCDSRCSSGSL